MSNSTKYLLYEIASGHKGFVHAGEGRSACLQTEGLSVELSGLFFLNKLLLAEWLKNEIFAPVHSKETPAGATPAPAESAAPQKA